MPGRSIVIMGAGGVGGYFGARLARAGTAVTLVARGAHLEAIRRDGLRVRSSVEGEYAVSLDATGDLAGRPPADAAILCVKAFDTDAALDALRPVIAPTTAVLSLQNGVDSADRIDARLGPGHAVGGAAYVFAGIAAPGVITHGFAGRIVLGELDGRATPRVERLRAALAAAGVPVEVTADIRRVLWEKYLMIAAQAGVTALTRCPTGTIRSTPSTWRLYRTIVEELEALARASGVDLAKDVVDRIVEQASRLAPETRSSLADDLARGRRLELEALHGHAVHLGERLGVPTPAVFTVYAALAPHAAGRSESPAGRSESPAGRSASPASPAG